MKKKFIKYIKAKKSMAEKRNKLFSVNVNDLAEAQRASYARFLMKGITEELSILPSHIYLESNLKLLFINGIKEANPEFYLLKEYKKYIPNFIVDYYQCIPYIPNSINIKLIPREAFFFRYKYNFEISKSLYKRNQKFKVLPWYYTNLTSSKKRIKKTNSTWYNRICIIPQKNFYKNNFKQKNIKISNNLLDSIIINEKASLYKDEIKLKFDKNGIDQVLLNNKSYTAKLYVKGSLSFNGFSRKFNLINSKIKNSPYSLLNSELLRKYNFYKNSIETLFYLGQIPLMTPEGTFIFNGCERILISQIIRSPGIYFKRSSKTKIINKLNTNVYIATLISDNFKKTEFYYDNVDQYNTQVIDKRKEFYIKMNSFESLNLKNFKLGKNFCDNNKLYLYDLITNFLNNESNLNKKKFHSKDLINYKIINSMKYPEIFLKSEKNKLSREFNENGDLLSIEEKECDKKNIKAFINELKATHNNNFSIGVIGRYKLNKKLMLNLPFNETQLSTKDFLGIIDGLIELKYFNRSNDDMDHIKEKLIRSSGEILQTLFKNALLAEKGIIQLMKKKKPLFQDHYLTNMNNKIPYSFYYYDPKKVSTLILESKIFENKISDINLFGKYNLKKKKLSNINAYAFINFFKNYKKKNFESKKKELNCKVNLHKTLKFLKKKKIKAFVKKDIKNYTFSFIQKFIVWLFIQEEYNKYENNKNLTYFSNKYKKIFLNKNETPINFYDSSIIINYFKQFFITSELAQYMDQTNPLAELTHKRRISVLGPSGVTRDIVSSDIRDIHPSQYGKICPIETPEGINAGLLTSITMYARISALGWIETPYFLLNCSEVLRKIKPIYLSPYEESFNIIGFSDISLNKNGYIKANYISVKKDYVFNTTKTKNVNYLTTSPTQIMSLATSLIPFVEHNDANRALMGSNMQRQAAPLVLAQKPLIGTGLEASACLDSGMVITSLHSGYVLFSSSTVISIKNLNSIKIRYILRKHRQSNQYASFNQKPAVWIGEKVFSGQVIADGPSTNNGELALGRNLTVAYMAWDGYNYEDAIILNERLIHEDTLTSMHIEEFEFEISPNEIISKNLPCVENSMLVNLDNYGIVKVGTYVFENDILIGKISPNKAKILLPEEKLLEKISENIFNFNPKTISTPLTTPYGVEGRVIDIRILASDTSILYKPNALKIYIYIANIKKVEIGDKLAGRHGNKGIVSRILPQQDMPYLPDGTPIDILLNPLGVPSRMNAGQIFECLLGLASENLNSRFIVVPFDEIYGKEASRVLINQKLKEAAIKTQKNWLFNTTTPGKIYLRDGRTGDYFDNPITVGKSYILKLVHLVEDKIHARSVGPYAMITEQPLEGKSSNGGQRFGEMEVWALEAHGCSNILKELLMVKSDDITGREAVYESIISNKISSEKKSEGSISETFLILIRELNSLGLHFTTGSSNILFNSALKRKSEEKDLFKLMEKRLKLQQIYNNLLREFNFKL